MSLKCRLPNRISFDVFGRCFCKVETKARATLRSCAKHLGGLAVTTLPGASRSFNPALRMNHVVNSLLHVQYLTAVFLCYKSSLILPLRYVVLPISNEV